MTARIGLLAGVAAVAVALAIAAAPREPTPDQRATSIAAELRCPVCQGLSVADSPSDTAREMRALIDQRIREGRTDDDIRAEFRRAYGDWVLLSPPLIDPRGAVWLIPFAVIGLGALLVGARVGRPMVTAPSPEQAALLRQHARSEPVE